MPLDDTVLIAGAGLSAAAGLPTTGELTTHFLAPQTTGQPAGELQDAISDQIRVTVVTLRDHATVERFQIFRKFHPQNLLSRF